MSSAGLSLARTKLLTRIDEGEPMNQATLAGLLGLAPRSVTDAIDALERNGLVARIEDEGARRQASSRSLRLASRLLSQLEQCVSR